MLPRPSLLPGGGDWCFGATASTGCTLPLSAKGKEKTQTLANLRFWQGQKDSNPQQRFWRPTCYHYTMPLCSLEQDSLYRKSAVLSIPKFPFFGFCLRRRGTLARGLRCACRDAADQENRVIFTDAHVFVSQFKICSIVRRRTTRYNAVSRGLCRFD